MVSAYGQKTKNERFNSMYYNVSKLFEETQHYSIAELEEYQNKKLRELLRYVYEYVPYYRNIFDKRNLVPEDIKAKSDLCKLPVLSKVELRQNFRQLISTQYTDKNLKMGHTSGTTGSPLEVAWDQNIEIVTNAVLWRHRRWSGFEFGEKYATLLGRVIVPVSKKTPPFYRVNMPWNQYLFSSFHLEDGNIEKYFETFEKKNIQYLEAYPSTAYILAKYLEQHNLHYNMNSVLTSSETLLPIQREIIEERFMCRVFDYYGMAERVMFSGECGEHNGHHLNMEYGITEFLDEHYNQVEEGVCGKVIATGLHNYGMPLIRYDTGDVSGVKGEQCACGRKLPLLVDVTTKAEDIVVTPTGRLVSSSILTHPFKPMKYIEKSQIIQDEYNQIEIKIVKKQGYTNADTENLLKAMKERIGSDMKITVNFVDMIPLGANGKYRWVISKVPIKYGSEKSKNLYSE